MALQQRAQHVPPMVLILVRLVSVNITTSATPALVVLRVVREPEKRLLVLRHRIVFVLKTFVLAPVALQQRAQHVPPMVLTFVCLVPVNITRLTTPALVVLQRVAPAPEKQLLVLRIQIVFALETFVLVPMAL